MEDRTTRDELARLIDAHLAPILAREARLREALEAIIVNTKFQINEHANEDWYAGASRIKTGHVDPIREIARAALGRDE